MGGGLIALVFLLFNFWLAGRLLPPPDPDRPSPFAGWFERLAGRTTRGARLAGESRPPVRPGGNRMGPRAVEGIVLSADDLPDLAPIARWSPDRAGHPDRPGRGRLGRRPLGDDPAVAQPGALQPGRRSPGRDPIFGRDISFYLFELPFLRWIQSAANGLLLAALAVSAGRYLIGGLRGGITFTTQMRVHLAVLAGLYLASIAVGYQLDKLELVYSTNGVAAGVSFTDQNARFLAFDVLTVVAGDRRRAPRRRGVHPDALAARRGDHLLAECLGRPRPDLSRPSIQRLAVEPDQLGKETTYIENNIAMTRIAYGLDRWTVSDYSGQDQLTAGGGGQRAGTFQNARLWDAAPAARLARPAPDRPPVLRLHERRHRPLQ